MTDRVPATLRLRSAGVGVVIGGIGLVVLGFLLPFEIAAGLLLVVGVTGMGAGRTREQWLLQLFLGIGAIGAIGLIETTTAAGLGLSAQQLGGAGIVFGLVDVVAGTVLHLFQSHTT